MDSLYALVTGADRGLGLALSAGLLERGWQVFAGQYMPDWPELEALAGKYPRALHILPLDVSSIDSAKAAAQAAAEVSRSHRPADQQRGRNLAQDGPADPRAAGLRRDAPPVRCQCAGAAAGGGGLPAADGRAAR